ncbi:hypothetical protein DUI87_07586 [Hirundo rustica rustica]|uniref:PLAT domain-containing protein n=1 Tax=Hirundo rustica rustica TaxID=333673 RepID=A0A3M0KQF7_HIRRU|nr:hypothetical protein DUI87_07586 [Hirundo rustica rustica]
MESGQASGQIHPKRGEQQAQLDGTGDEYCNFKIEKNLETGSVGVFEVEAVSLGKLQKVLLHCEASPKSQHWYCDKVIFREAEKNSEYVFNCERWLPFMSQGIMHSEIELYPQEEDWKITVVTGDFETAGTTATVFLYAYGENRASGPITLGSGKEQLFDPNSKNAFKPNDRLDASEIEKGSFIEFPGPDQESCCCLEKEINPYLATTTLRKDVESDKVNLIDLGLLHKIRIGRDNTGNDPRWYLEEVTFEKVVPLSVEEICLPIESWLSKDKDECDTWREVAIRDPVEELLPCLLSSSKTYQNINFVFSAKQLEMFIVYMFQRELLAVSLGDLEKVLISHDGAGPDNFGIKDGISYSKEKLLVLNWSEKDCKNDVMAGLDTMMDLNKKANTGHNCDHWGAETFANVYLTLYSKRGDTGVRKLHTSLTKGRKVQSNKVDSVLVEAVSLSHLQKVAIGHDGEGYGVEMYLKMVTVKESQDSNKEWVFPFWNWLDTHLGLCETVYKIVTVVEMRSIQRLFLLTQDELADIGSIYKVQVTGPHSELKQPWHLDLLHMKHTGTKEEMYLAFDCWFNAKEDKCVELPALYADQEPLPVVEYEIHFHKGDLEKTDALERFIFVYKEKKVTRGSDGLTR